MGNLWNCKNFGLTSLFILAAILTSLSADKRPVGLMMVKHLRGIPTQQTMFSRISRLGFSVELMEHNVNLRWNSVEPGKVGFYTIEKSENGSRFREVALLMTSENESNEQVYRYQDKLGASETDKIYYRVRVNYLQGNVQYSDIKRLPGQANGRKNNKNM